METLTIENNDAKLYTSIHPNAGRETIILLHGGPGVPDDLISITEMLASSFQIISFHQRGTGLSPSCKDYSLDRYLYDIDTIARYFKLDKFHLFGHSWGGLYAQIYAEYSPGNISSLFLCSPSSGTNETWKKTEKEVMQFNKNNASKKEWSIMGWNSLLGMFGSDKAYQKLFKQVLKNYHKHYFEVEIEDKFLNKIHTKPVNKTRKEIVKYKFLSILNKPNYPITITYGENDVYGESKKELLKRFPTAKVETIEKCGHIPWKHNPKAFNSILNRFYLEKE